VGARPARSVEVVHAPLLRLIVSLAPLLALAPPIRAETAPDSGRWSVGTSAWMLANVFPDPPQFYYLEVDRTVAPRDALVLEAATWTYRAPIGIPYGSSFGDASEEYPGFVRSIGLALGWRRSLYRGLNASARSFHFLQLYSEDDRPRKTGYLLFLQARLGWRWAARAPGPWIEPSVAFNWWPVEVGRPASFRAKDSRWPSYFLFEPWLNVGWRW
jgi:hypothetical protein